MEDKIKYQCSGCQGYFDLANVNEKAYDFQTERVEWLCPNCYEVNFSKVRKYYDRNKNTF